MIVRWITGGLRWKQLSRSDRVLVAEVIYTIICFLFLGLPVPLCFVALGFFISGLAVLLATFIAFVVYYKQAIVPYRKRVLPVRCGFCNQNLERGSYQFVLTLDKDVTLSKPGSYNANAVPVLACPQCMVPMKHLPGKVTLMGTTTSPVVIPAGTVVRPGEQEKLN